MDLFKLFALNICIVVFGFFGCSAIERIGGRGTVTMLIVLGTVSVMVYIGVTATRTDRS